MAAKFHAIANEALTLDPADRLRLAAALIDSVEGPADSDWGTAWMEELGRRSSEADAREACGEPRGDEWSAVRARLLVLARQ